MKFLLDVVRFYRVMGDGHLISRKPIAELVPVREANRTALLQEEVQEFANAKTLEDKADALVDILYILGGAIIEHGLHDRFESLWNTVHAANMSKVCKNQAHVDQTVMMYQKAGVSVLRGVYGPVVKRTTDMKVLKPMGWTSPNLKPILEAESFDGITVDDLVEASNDVASTALKSASPLWKTVDHTEKGGMTTKHTQAMEVEGVGVLVRVFGSAQWSSPVFMPGVQIVEVIGDTKTNYLLKAAQ
jgi:hypothetical protein